MTTPTPDMPDEIWFEYDQDGLPCAYDVPELGTIKYLRSDLAAPSQWRDISSCPKPSGRVLLAAKTPFGYAVQYGHWYSINNTWVYDGYSFGNATTQPDFWQPLPQPPTLKEKI